MDLSLCCHVRVSRELWDKIIRCNFLVSELIVVNRVAPILTVPIIWGTVRRTDSWVLKSNEPESHENVYFEHGPPIIWMPSHSGEPWIKIIMGSLFHVEVRILFPLSILVFVKC